MKVVVSRVALGMVLAGAFWGSVVHAQQGVKALPTLLIKGDVVSLDSTDPAAMLLTVKDRYGFETPIYLTPETKVSQGDAVLELTSLATGTIVEVEYNFDVNTAKRHAVTVKVAAAAAAEAAPTTAPALAAPEATPVPPASAAESVAPAEESVEEGAPAVEEAAPVSP